MRSMFRWYGLRPKEPVKLTEHTDVEDGRKKTQLFQGSHPDKIEVVREYPFFIQLRGTWHSLHDYHYDFCVEKASIYTGAIAIKRLTSGQTLKALELQSDYERNQRKEK